MHHIKVNLDSRNRIPLTRVLGDCPSKTFEMYWEEDRLILEPLVEIPQREAWLYKNKEALNSVKQGIKDAEEKKLYNLGSFSKYLDDEEM